jgi:hypothetical protein
MDKIKLHPSEKELLLFMDGELRKRQATRIEEHLAACWQCRAEVARTEAAIGDFVALRRKLFDHQLRRADLPSERASRALLGARLTQMAEPRRWKPLGLAFWPAVFGYRPIFTAGSLVALLAILLVLQPMLAPGVSAMEVIQNTRAAEERRPPETFLHQRIRIERRAMQGPAVATLNCELWKNAGRSRLLVTDTDSEPAKRLRELYRSRGADWQNLLSAASFARLRESLGDVRDEVSGREQITVITTPARAESSGDLKRLELTVRRSDWHAISQRIETREADYELTEVLEEKLARDKVDPAIFFEPPAAKAAPPVLAALRRIRPTLIPAPSGPTTEQLDRAEIQLREGLHQTGADVEEVPEIQREPGGIRLRLFAETTQRRQEILTALGEVPYLARDVSDAQSITSTGNPPNPSAVRPLEPKLYTKAPPLAKALREYSGGLDPANDYVNAVRDSYLQVLVDASALARLAERYSDPEWNRLPAESQQRLNGIAADHLHAIRTNLPIYLGLVAPVLEEMSRKEQFHASGPAEAPKSGCASWRSAALPLVADLGSLETAFRRLFVEERSEQPVNLSATELLGQSFQAWSRLQHREWCQP